MVETHPRRQLTQLIRDIEGSEAEVARLEAERKAISRKCSRARRRLLYLRLARRLRRPALEFEFWPVLVLIVGSGFAGLLLFILAHYVFDSLLLALLMLIVGAGAAAAALASLLYRPPDALLESSLGAAEGAARLENARLTEKLQRIGEENERLQRLVEERRDQIASGKLQRAALLQRPWKSMGEAEWEDFVVEVCRTLDGVVKRTGQTGGQDANLIVQFGERRVAVLTRAEAHNVSSATIQQAIAAKERHRCDSCAVIINRRFTGAAQDFAQRQGCAAIGAGEFPDFVLGKIEL